MASSPIAAVLVKAPPRPPPSLGKRQRSVPRLRLEAHGTGCTLAAAAAALLPGNDVLSAVRRAKDYLNAALAAAGELDVGSGRGPVHHFHALWTQSRTD